MVRKFLLFSFLYLLVCILIIQFIIPLKQIKRMEQNFDIIPTGNVNFNYNINEVNIENLNLIENSQSNQIIFKNNIIDHGIIEIPKLSIRQPFKYSTSDVQMDQSIWLFSKNKSLEEKIIFGAHRYNYNDPSTSFFFKIDQLENGDIIKINDKTWTVFDKQIVKAKNIDILKPDNNRTLLLFSCDPYWSGESRIIIFAKLNI